jgi:endogenous inhibitor of DNA gyrase (YacG/DUF329 family)
MPNSHLISCPTCHKEHDWTKSKPWSPFCCERCKLIDLGEWASEKYKIPLQQAIIHQTKNTDSKKI